MQRTIWQTGLQGRYTSNRLLYSREGDPDASDAGTAGLVISISRAVGIDNPDLLAIMEQFGNTSWSITLNHP